MFLTATKKTAIQLDDYERDAAIYLNSRRSEAPRSTLRRLASIREFAKWAWRLAALMDYKPPRPGEPVPHPLKEGMAGIRKMIANASNLDQLALAALQGYFALRVSEARSITAASFDTDSMTLTVRGKGDKVRYLPYSAETFAILEMAYRRSAADGKPLVRLSDSGARFAIKRMAYLACLAGNPSSHDLRATCLTDLYDRTHDIRLVQDFAGHVSIEQTKIYIRTNREAMRAAVNFVGVA